MPTTPPPSARALTDDEAALVDLTRRTIDATTDAEPDEDGIHTMGAAVRSADGRTFAGVRGCAGRWRRGERRPAECRARRRGEGRLEACRAPTTPPGARGAARSRRHLPAQPLDLYHFTGGPCAELVALGSARAAGATEITHIVAVGNHGRGPVGPCGRDRQVLLDLYPGIRVILPTREGVRSVAIEDLMPLATSWSIGDGAGMA